MKRFQLTTFLCIVCIQATVGQSWQDTLSRIDKAFAQYQATTPGCRLSISRNGVVLFSKAWGMPDLEQNTPLPQSHRLAPVPEVLYQ